MCKQLLLIVIHGLFKIKRSSNVKIHFIINEHAGSGKGKIIWEKMKKSFSLPHEKHITEYAGHAKKIAKNIAQKSAEEILIIAVGGDIHEVVDGRKVKYNNFHKVGKLL